MTSNNGNHPDEIPPKPETSALAPAPTQLDVEKYVRQIVREELVQGINQLREKGLLGPLQNQPLQQETPAASTSSLSSGVTGAIVNLFATALENPDKLIALVGGVCETVSKVRMAMAPQSNPLAMLEYVKANHPQLLSLYSPNPYGDGFRLMMQKSYEMGLSTKIAGEQLKKGLAVSPGPSTPIALPEKSTPSNPPTSVSSPALPSTPGIPMSNKDVSEYLGVLARSRS